MAGLDATQVRSAVTGKLLMAPVGNAKPTDTASAWPAGWVDLGYADDSGPPAEMQPGWTTKPILGWQSFYEVRELITGRTLDLVFKLIQKNGTNLKLAFGGGTITALGGGDFKYVPPATSFVDEHAFGIEISDGTIIDRCFIDRGLVSKVDSIPFRKDDAIKFGLTISVLAPTGSNDPWNWISNDPAMAS